MKKLLLTLLLSAGSLCTAQIKSTGAVTLGGGLTATIELNTATSVVTYTLAGPSNKWFAIGLNATTMSSTNPTDIIQYGTSLLDRHLTGGNSAPTTDTASNLTLVSNTVNGSTRTIVATRPFNTSDNKDYTFTSGLNSLNIIWAVGNNTTVNAQHGFRGTQTVTFATLGAEDFTAEKHVMLFPIPASSLVNISNPKNLSIDAITIFDTNGKIVLTRKTAATDAEIPVDVSQLAKGLYFMEITAEGQRAVKKFEKI